MRWLLMVLMLLPVPAVAKTDPAVAKHNMALCRNAAIKAADRHGVPRAVMIAITLVETRTNRGGQSGAWPWTVNVTGKGFWFDSRAAALLHAQTTLNGGEKSFDVGCFQLNFRWHGEHFRSIDEMFEPGPSGDYAARFVKSLYAETGDWIKASGLYHSRTPKHSTKYRNLIAKTMARLGAKVPAPVAVAAAPSKAPRIFRRTTGGLFPVETGNAQTKTVRRSAGSVGTLVLRRGKGGLLRPAEKGVGG